jgi:hypothetical protein
VYTGVIYYSKCSSFFLIELTELVLVKSWSQNVPQELQCAYSGWQWSKYTVTGCDIKKRDNSPKISVVFNAGTMNQTTTTTTSSSSSSSSSSTGTSLSGACPLQWVSAPLSTVQQFSNFSTHLCGLPVLSTLPPDWVQRTFFAGPLSSILITRPAQLRIPILIFPTPCVIINV